MYNCKSDTITPAGNDDIAMSSTCFIEKHMSFAVMYGCIPDVMDDTRFFLEKMSRTSNLSAFHPMFVPMVYAELERQRLLNVLDEQRSDLDQRILDMQNKLKDEDLKKSKAGGATGTGSVERDCQIARLWGDVSSLKNGLMSLREQLVSMIEHLGTLQREIFSKHTVDEMDGHCIREAPGEKIKMRLREMIREFDTKVRQCDGVLGKATLAAQMVSSLNAVIRRFSKGLLTKCRNGTTIQDKTHKRTSS